MASALHAEFDRLAASILPELHSAVEKGDWAGAETIANRLTLKGIVQKVRPKLEEMAVSALLFGAHRVTERRPRDRVHEGQGGPGRTRARARPAGARGRARRLRLRSARSCTPRSPSMKRGDARAHMQKPAAAQGRHFGRRARRDRRPPGARAGPAEGRSAGRARSASRRSTSIARCCNAADLVAWAQAQGFQAVLPPDDMHVTVCYSKAPLDWRRAQDRHDRASRKGHDREMALFGDAVVLKFRCPRAAGGPRQVHGRRREPRLRRLPAARDHQLRRTSPDPTRRQTEPYHGPLVFGPEVFAPVKRGLEGRAWSSRR